VADFDATCLTNLVWSYSNMKIQAPALFEAIGAEAPKNIDFFNSYHLSTLICAFSQLQVKSPGMHLPASKRQTHEIGNWDPRKKPQKDEPSRQSGIPYGMRARECEAIPRPSLPGSL
jgi:hypothetical protein